MISSWTRTELLESSFLQQGPGRSTFLAHLSRRWAYSIPMVRRPSIVRRRPSSTISNINISATSGPIATKFYLKHHWVGDKVALGFGPDQIRTLVSMATENSHRVIMEKTVSPLFLDCFSSDPFHTCRRWWHAWELGRVHFGLIGPPTAELAALERLKKIPIGL